eukprot:365268-Chlamydomonas_euryale.AAC.16
MRRRGRSTGMIQTCEMHLDGCTCTPCPTFLAVHATCVRVQTKIEVLSREHAGCWKRTMLHLEPLYPVNLIGLPLLAP